MALSGAHEHALADLSDVAAIPNDGEVLTFDQASGTWVAAPPSTNAAGQVVGIDLIIGDGLHLIDVGAAGTVLVPFAGTVVSAALIADQTGSIVVDVLAGPLADPLVLSSITGGNPAMLAGEQAAQNSALPGWTTAIPANTVLAANVQNASGVKRVTLALTMQRGE